MGASVVTPESGDAGPGSVARPTPRSYSARINHPVDGLISSLRVSRLARVTRVWKRPASTAGFARHALPFLNIEKTFRASTPAHRSSPQSTEILLRELM